MAKDTYIRVADDVPSQYESNGKDYRQPTKWHVGAGALVYVMLKNDLDVVQILLLPGEARQMANAIKAACVIVEQREVAEQAEAAKGST